VADLYHDGRDAGCRLGEARPEFAAGKKAVVAEDWDGAIAVLKSAALRDPRNADIQNYIGYAYRRLRQMGPAIGHYQQALMLNPRHRSAHEHLGEAHLVLGDPATGRAASTKVQPQPSADGRDAPSVFDGILSNIKSSPEISTRELRAALTDSSAIILDARPYDEYGVSHIPGARAVPAKPGTTPALYVADATEVAKTIPDKTQPLFL
jgi:tetratricopeptide (TPR) repeat protein